MRASGPQGQHPDREPDDHERLPGIRELDSGEGRHVVQKLRGGAIILAKSNLDDFAAAVYGVSSIAGPMHNPYALDCTVGGSSGRSAAAVSVGYPPRWPWVPTGGSLRIPRRLQQRGHDPADDVGLVSRSGILPRSLTQDTAGPIARTVARAAVGLDLMAGYDATDPMTARGVSMIPKGDTRHTRVAAN